MTAQTGPTATSNPYLPSNLRIPVDEESFDFFLLDTLNKITDATNDKTIGIHIPAEVYNGEVWNYTTPNNTVKYGYRTIIYIPPSLPNTGTQTYPHNIQGINSDFAITNLYVAASNRTTLSYRVITGDNVTMNATNVTITTAFNGTGYQAYVVIEYLRNA